MMRDSQSSTWRQAEWRAEVEAWIADQLRSEGMKILGPIDQPHIRPWSTVLRVPSDHGDIYFKAAAPALAYEAGVVDLLSRWRPENIPPLIACDRSKGWLLMQDGGDRLREVLKRDLTFSHWENALRDYALLQLETAAHIDELLEAGLIDRRPEDLFARFEALLAETAMDPLGSQEALSQAEIEGLGALVGYLKSELNLLAEDTISPSIDHGDFHDGNIFVHQRRYLFFDWGDSSLTHPFFSLRTVFVSVERTFGLPEGSALQRLIEAYLKPFSRLAPNDGLRAAFDRAQRLAPIPSALRWREALELADEFEKQKYAAAVPSLMRELLQLNS